MSPETQKVLRTIADLAEYAQAHPTDSKGIQFRTVARNKAAMAWTQAGSPDLQGTKPLVVQPGTGRVDARDEQKDWTPVRVLVEVKRTTEKALLLDDGDGHAFWCPRSLIGADDDDLREVGDVGTASLPRWVLPE